jgi:peptidoglycan/xylan/chitin deacetylase (PgdA/CDA1 family)
MMGALGEDGSALSRRRVLGGALAGAAGLVTGCSGPAPVPLPDAARPTVGAAPTVGAPTVRTAPRPSTPASSAGSPDSAPTPSPQASASSSPSPRVDTPAEIVRRATVPVLCYHQLREWRSGDSAYARSDLICPPRNFRRHLDALADDGWTTVSPDQYLAYLATGQALPEKPVMLSFDDGTRSHADEALPQLAKREMTATFFVMTVVLDKPNWLRTRHLARLADAGMTIGGHTYDHPGVDVISGEQWKVQLEESRETLREASGQPVSHFAYPFGIVRRRAYRHLEAARYSTAFQLEERKIDRVAPLYTLRRFIVGSTWTGAELLGQVRKRRQ